MEELRKKVSYLVYGFAALAVIVVVSSVYFFVQQGALENKIQRTLFDQNLQLQAGLTQLEKRVTNLEQTSPFKSAQLFFYYDSSCTTCNNAKLLAELVDMTAAMKAKNVAVQSIDVKTAGATVPVRKAPSFYATLQSVAGNQYLAASMSAWIDNGFQFERTQNGVTLTAPQYTSLLAPGCAQNRTVRVDAFYAADSLPGQQGAANAKDYLNHTNGSYLFYSHCVAFDNNGENKCVADLGAAAFNESLRLYNEYDVKNSTDARFVVDCKYEFPALSADEFKAGLCFVRPDACAWLNATVV